MAERQIYSELNPTSNIARGIPVTGNSASKIGNAAARLINSTRAGVNGAKVGNSLSVSNASKAVSNAAASIGSAASSGKGWFANFFSGKQPMVLLLIAIILLFVIVILYIMFNIKNNKLVGKVLTKNVIQLDEVSSAVEIPSSDIPKTVVGREYSYSFWIYINEYNQTFTKDGQGNVVPIDKMLFYRGAPSDITTANPIVTMDGLSNKMFIAIKTQESTLYSGSVINYNNNLYNIRYMNYFMNSSLKIRDMTSIYQPYINKHVILTVDYIPLQRWVNVSFIVDNKICTVFMDGEIYSVKSTEEFKAIREPELDIRGRPIDVNIIVDKTDNTIFIGKNTVGAKTSVPGYLSKMQFFNYAISLNEVKKIYNAGPNSKNFLGMNKPINSTPASCSA